MRLAAAVVLVCGIWAPATAQPSVRVRAQARIELEAEVGEASVIVSGILHDDLGAALPGRALVVRLVDGDGTERFLANVRTGPGGRFSTRAPVALDAFVASATYDGDVYYDRASVERAITSRQLPVHLALEIAAGDAVDLDAPFHDVTVRADSDAGADGLRVTLRDERGDLLAEGATGPDGVWRVRLPSQRLGEPGPGRLVAQTPGDSRRTSARTELPIVRQRRTFLDLSTPSPRTLVGESVVLEGSLRDGVGPLAGRAVGIFAGRTHRATVLTDERGRFRWQGAPALREGTAPIEFRARFDSDGPGVRSCESEPVMVLVAGPTQSRWAWALLPLVACGLVLLWSRRRSSDAGASPPTHGRPGLVATAPHRARRASRRVAGVVRDARDETALGGRLSLTGPGDLIVPFDEEGFSVELPDGTWQATFEAQGRAPQSASFTIPHDGRWDGVEVRLETWRARALRVLRTWVERHAPAQPWRRRTLRELQDALPAPGDALAGEVEHLYYGPVAPDADRVRDIEARADLEPDDDER